MNPLRNLASLAALSLLLVGGALPAQKIKDTILKKDGARLRGVEIVDMTTTSVVFKRGAEQAELPAVQLASIQWSEPPEEFAQATVAENRGDFEAAANLYAEASKKSDRKVFQLEAKFLANRALVHAAVGRDAARAQTAADSLASFVGEVGKGLRAPEAKLLQGKALRMAGKGAEAEKILKEIEDTAVKENWGFVWDARAKYEKALAQLAQNKPADARSAYQSVASAVDAALAATPGGKDSEMEELRMLSLVGQGETYIAEKNPDQASSYFDGLAQRSQGKSPALYAAALAGKGEALYLKAGASKDPALLRRAQIELAQASIHDTGTGATTAKALYYTGKLILDLGASRESEQFKARARSYFESVLRNYGQTPFAALAKAELEKK